MGSSLFVSISVPPQQGISPPAGGETPSHRGVNSEQHHAGVVTDPDGLLIPHAGLDLADVGLTQ